jgi:predicted dienelactone hydrolase
VKPSTRLRLLAVISLSIFFNDCGGSNSQNPPPNVTITVTSNVSTLLAGGTAQVTATVANDPAHKGVTWSVSCGSQPCGSVSPTSTGSGTATTYTASSTPPSFDTIITILATSVSNPQISNAVGITVSGLTLVVNPPTQTVNIGTSAQFIATVGNDPGNQGVSWSVACPAAPCGTVSPTATASGAPTTYSAPATFPAGNLSVVLTATAVANTGATAAASITVPGTNVVVNPPSATVIAGANAPFTATVTNDPQHKGVTWSVQCSPSPCGNVAPLNTASGVATTYTAPAAPPPVDLPVTVTATSVFNPGVSAGAAVTVPAITVAVSPLSAYIPVQIALQFTATVGNDPGNQGVQWSLQQGSTSCTSACGTVSPATTASGAAATYTAPSSVPAGGPITLTGTSITDPTKTAAATITVSSGTVMLVPASLNFGSRLQGTTSPAKTVVLTNTGSSALAINSITTTGTNPTEFALTQSAPCGTSVSPGGTCTIGLTFKPGGTGARSANLTISDSSTDTPQQVPLSGTGIIPCTAQIKKTLSAAPVRTALATLGSVAAPAPTGPNTVGTRSLRLVDSGRADPFLENGSRRELLVRFWYPANLRESCTGAEYTSPEVWSYFSQLLRLPLPGVTTNSCLNADIAEGAHPVVVFTHGYTGTFTDYTFLFEDLASRGYVVASVNHTYEATAVKFPDGRFLHSGFGSHLGNKLLEDRQSLAFALSVRLEDLAFVGGQLRSLNENARSPFAGRLDLSRVAIAGHSMGGLAAALTVEHDLRFKAGVILDVHDGFIPAEVVGSTRTPVLIVASGREQWTENECRLWNNLRGPRFAVNLAGAEHLTTSDAVWLARGAVKTGTMGSDKSISAIRNYVADFLDTSLRDYSANPRLTQGSSEYPDVKVNSPAQDLCAKGSE